jgi:hypothetical protein
VQAVTNQLCDAQNIQPGIALDDALFGSMAVQKAHQAGAIQAIF